MRYLKPFSAAALAISSLALPAYAQSSFRVYRLGNSLSFQSQSPGIASMATTRGFSPVTVGLHANCGSSLINTWQNPNTVCVTSIPSNFTPALADNDWDALSVQPFKHNLEYHASASTIATDTQVSQDLLTMMRARPGSANAPMFIYAVHPYLSTTQSYDSLWLATEPDTGTGQFTTASRQYYDRLFANLEPLVGASSLSLVPTGEVMFQLHERMKRGEFPGFTNVYQTYSDDIHLTGVGNYLLGVTNFAAMTGQDPWGMTAPAQYGGGGILSATQYNILHDTIWRTLCTDSRVRPIWHSENWPYKVHRVGHLRESAVRTNGTLVEAVNLGSASSVTVNGVTFTGSLTRDGLASSHSASSVYGNGGIGSDFETLMDSFAYADPVASPATLTLTGLTVGKRYEVQLFVADQRNATTQTRRNQFELRGKSPFYFQQGLGATITGAFVATGTTETLTIRAAAGSGETGNGSPVLNAFQVRQVDASSAELAALSRPWAGTGADANWSTATNWLGSQAPAAGQIAAFDANSTARLTNTLSAATSLSGLRVADPAGPVTIGGSALTIGADGIDLSAATQDLSLATPLTLSASQTWQVPASRTLTLGSAPAAQALTPGGNALTIANEGSVLLQHSAAENSSPISKSGNGTLTVNSALNLINAEFRILGGTVNASGGRLFTATNYVSGGGLRVLGGRLEISDWNYSSGSLGYLRANTDAITLDGGTLCMTATSSYNRGFTIASGGATFEAAAGVTWTLAFHAGAPVSNSSGPLTLSGAGNGVFDKVFPGNTAATLTKSGTGTWTLTQANTATGATTVQQGTLLVNGSLASGAVTVSPGGTLGGTGTINGAATIHGILAPGTSVGTLRFASGLVLGSSATLACELGTTSDLVSVTGNLTLDGTVNVANSGGLATGIYDLIHYTGTLTDQTLTIGTTSGPTTFHEIDTRSPGKVCLLAASSAFELWQLRHFGSTTAAAAQSTHDADADGQTNGSEFTAGTDPNNRTDVFTILESTFDNGAFTIRWSAIPGKTYQVLTSETLTSPWSDTLPGCLITAGPAETTLQYHDTTSPAAPRRFYKVEVVP